MIGWRRIVQRQSLISYHPPFPQFLEISSCSSRSRIFIAHNSSLTLMKKGIQIIEYSADIAPRQATRNFNRFNSNDSFNKTADLIAEICLAFSEH